MKPRAAWSDSDYATATGRDTETVTLLKNRVAQGTITVTQARASAMVQGVDPDRIGKAAK